MIYNNEEVQDNECMDNIMLDNENPIFELLENKNSKELAQKYAKYLYEIHGKTPDDIEDMFDNMGGGIPYDTLVNVKEEFLKINNK